MQDTFDIDGNTYRSHPSLEELLIDAGISNQKIKTRVLTIFKNAGIDDITQLYSYSKSNLDDLPSFSERLAKLASRLLQLVPRMHREVGALLEVPAVDESQRGDGQRVAMAGVAQHR